MSGDAVWDGVCILSVRMTNMVWCCGEFIPLLLRVLLVVCSIRASSTLFFFAFGTLCLRRAVACLLLELDAFDAFFPLQLFPNFVSPLFHGSG